MEKTHVFESAGLGKAPFKFTGWYEDRGPKSLGDGTIAGSTGQPMGTCAYCGTGIAICCRIESADGKSFVVGSDCVNKTGDKGLKVEVDKIKAKLNREKQDKVIAENLIWVEEHSAELSLLPYGKYSMLDSIRWFYKNAGRSGKIRIIKVAKHALAASKDIVNV